MIHPTYIDFIYKMSSLNYFVDSHRIEQPHFVIHRDHATYAATDHYVVEAKIELHKLQQMKKDFGIEENSVFLETLVKNARVQLEKHFIKYVEFNSETLDMKFYRQNNMDRFVQFFRANNRISLRRSSKHRDIKKGTYFLGVLADLYRENMFMDDQAFIIISPDMANFVATSIEEFKKATNNYTNFLGNVETFDTDLMYPAGLIELGINGGGRVFGNINVVINKELPNDTVYFGMKNPQGLNLFYYIDENGVTSHDSMPSPNVPLSIDRIYRLNMYYTLQEINKKTKFFKIIFNDVN